MQYIYKKVNSGYIAWFSKSNQWVRFEEPAWYVNKLFQKDISRKAIALKVRRKYGISERNSTRFVHEICDSLVESHKAVDYKLNTAHTTASEANFSVTSDFKRIYRIYNKVIEIEYGSRLAEYYIHPPFEHLEISQIPGTIDAKYRIDNTQNDGPRLINENEGTSFVFGDYNQLCKRLHIDILNRLYDKTSTDWLSFVHASAISNGSESILLSSASGSGKSTMAALLQAKGLHVLSDDFVPIDAKQKRAYPFPAAISAKESAFSVLNPFYRDLNDTNYNNYEYLNKNIRYLKPATNASFPQKPIPIKCIVFIKYNPEADCNFQSLPVFNALQLFHEQAWVSDNPKQARIFLNWFIKLPCYTLEYGNTQQGIHTILELFNKTQSEKQ